MATIMVALRWDGQRISRQELTNKAGKADNVVASAYDHIDKLDIKAIPDEQGQYVQLIVQTDASSQDCEGMQKMLKAEFAKA